MNKKAHHTLLPTGLRDVLPPDAGHEADVTDQVLGHFADQGYQRVKTPLMEFTETLLCDATAEQVQQTFRVMDPLSQRMMAMRSDITPQVARVVRTRMAEVPRPLRLSYCGEVLRVQGSQLRPDRQFRQVGVELIGHDSAHADAEVIILVCEALMDLGVPGVSADLSLPILVPSILNGLNLENSADLQDGLNHKDSAAVAAAGGAAADILSALLAAVGPAEQGLAVLRSLSLPPDAAQACARLEKVVELVQYALPDLVLTLDPVENRDFEYHSGVAFTLFSRVVSGELGRGGRYRALGEEAAVGATLFMDSVLQALPKARKSKRIYVPFGTKRVWSQVLRMQGWTTVAGLEPHTDPMSEARRLGCDHLLTADGAVEVDGNSEQKKG